MKSKTAKYQSLLQITTFLVVHVLITYSMAMAMAMQVQSQAQAQVSRARLIQQASRVRKKLKLNLDLGNIPTKEDLFFPSSYEQEHGPRGFCNWLIVDRVMIGDR